MSSKGRDRQFAFQVEVMVKSDHRNIIGMAVPSYNRLALSLNYSSHSPYQSRFRTQELMKNHFPFVLAISTRGLIRMLQVKEFGPFKCGSANGGTWEGGNV